MLYLSAGIGSILHTNSAYAQKSGIRLTLRGAYSISKFEKESLARNFDFTDMDLFLKKKTEDFYVK